MKKIRRLKVAVRPKTVSDICGLMTFYGFKVCRNDSKINFQVNLRVLKWIKNGKRFAIKPLRHCVFGVCEISQRFRIVTSSTQHKRDKHS